MLPMCEGIAAGESGGDGISGAPPPKLGAPSARGFSL
jgi:hypothetical protein